MAGVRKGRGRECGYTRGRREEGNFARNPLPLTFRSLPRRLVKLKSLISLSCCPIHLCCPIHRPAHNVPLFGSRFWCWFEWCAQPVVWPVREAFSCNATRTGFWLGDESSSEWMYPNDKTEVFLSEDVEQPVKRKIHVR